MQCNGTVLGAVQAQANKAREINGFGACFGLAPVSKADKELVKPTSSISGVFDDRRPTHLDSALPRYFFNTRIGDELVVDSEGEVLRNPDRAWEAARSMILEILKSESGNAGLLSAVVEVTDEDGDIVLEFPFTEAMLDIWDEPATKH